MLSLYQQNETRSPSTFNPKRGPNKMTRTEFLSNCSKLSQVSVNGKQLSLSEKGKHHNDMGCSVLPGTERHAIQVWRKMENKRGGQRPGAGRPSTGRPTAMSFRFKDDVKDKLRQLAESRGTSATAIIEQLIMREKI